MSSISEAIQSAATTIEAARGLDMTFAGVTITFTALGSIALCIGALPHLLKILNKYVPEKSHAVAAKPKASGISNDVVAAIGLAYHSLKSSGK